MKRFPKMHKYQFYITFKHDKLGNTAASKAIIDCRRVLLKLGYKDCTIQNSYATDKRYLLNLLKEVPRFLYKVRPNSLLAVQYPLLSGNKWFSYLIKVMKIRKVRFFCIIHDLDALRFGKEQLQIQEEIQILNSYAYLIVHNDAMKNWLLNQGVIMPMISLRVFDYLTEDGLGDMLTKLTKPLQRKILYAGNLTKSAFIYKLDTIENWTFDVFGPFYNEQSGNAIENLNWKGQFTPDEIVSKLDGDFGLIWDGVDIHSLDDNFGSYLKFNNPHKFSLYLAAGLPVIAPKESAIAELIEEFGLGILISSLLELKSLSVSDSSYRILQNNVLLFNKKLKGGDFLSNAIRQVEYIDKIKQNEKI